MGSRRRRNAALVLAAALTGCTVGAPPGFSSGTSWTIPLVGPLEDGMLIVPAWVDNKGPFLFAIDTDAHVSIVDTDVVKATGARTGEGPDLLDESDTQRDRFYAEILEWSLGTLTVKNRSAQIVAAHTFDVDGRRIHGVIGRDILADSLTFSFDRDLGLVTLTTRAVFKPSAAATAIRYAPLSSQIKNAEVLPMSRRLAEATIGGQRFHMHLDFGATASQLRERSWPNAGLVESAISGSVLDEVGMPRAVSKQGVAAVVMMGAATAQNVVFVPYEDKRWPEQDLDGSLGLGFFKPFAVAVDWHDSKIYLRPRHSLADVTARIGRWQSDIVSSCKNPACVRIALIDPVAAMPADKRPATHPGVVATAAREPGTEQLDLEVLVAVSAADGKTSLPWLLVNLPAGAQRAITHVSADYAGATTTVLDASPYPRACPVQEGGQTACIDLLRH